MPQKLRKMVLMAKVESVYGVDAVPSASANALVVSDVSTTPIDGEEAERNNIKPFMGHSGTIRATQFKKLSFSTEYAGSGIVATPPGWGVLARACSMSETIVPATSVTYAPITDGQESCSFYCNVDGLNNVMLGSRGTVKLDLTAKNKPKLQWEFTGLWVPMADVPLPSATYTNWARPLAVNKANTTASLHAQAVAMQSLNLDLGNKLVKRDLVGVDTVEITDRGTSGSIVIENTLVATRNWVGLSQAKALGNLSVVHGVTAGNICTVNATGTVELGNLTYSDSDGIQMANVPLRFVPQTGNDEFTLVLT